jgi:hypothetical protein
MVVVVRSELQARRGLLHTMAGQCFRLSSLPLPFKLSIDNLKIRGAEWLTFISGEELRHEPSGHLGMHVGIRGVDRS